MQLIVNMPVGPYFNCPAKLQIVYQASFLKEFHLVGAVWRNLVSILSVTLAQ